MRNRPVALHNGVGDHDLPVDNVVHRETALLRTFKRNTKGPRWVYQTCREHFYTTLSHRPCSPFPLLPLNFSPTGTADRLVFQVMCDSCCSDSLCCLQGVGASPCGNPVLSSLMQETKWARGTNTHSLCTGDKQPAVLLVSLDAITAMGTADLVFFFRKHGEKRTFSVCREFGQHVFFLFLSYSSVWACKIM